MLRPLLNRCQPITAAVIDLSTRWRTWRLRHPLPMEIGAVMIGLAVFISSLQGDSRGTATPAAPPDVPSNWILLAIDASDSLELVVGDRVAILADGTVLSTDAIVTDTDRPDVVIALPIDEAGAVAAAGKSAVVARATSAQASISTMTPSTTR